MKTRLSTFYSPICFSLVRDNARAAACLCHACHSSYLGSYSQQYRAIVLYLHLAGGVLIFPRPDYALPYCLRRPPMADKPPLVARWGGSPPPTHPPLIITKPGSSQSDLTLTSEVLVQGFLSLQRHRYTYRVNNGLKNHVLRG